MKIVWRIPWLLRQMPRSSRTDVGHFWDLVVRKWYETHGMVNGSHDAQLCRERHPVFRAISASERGQLKSKGGGRKSIHLNGSEETIGLILRTVISVNKVSVYGAVAELCKELDPDSRNQTEGEICESLVVPTEIPNANAISQSSTSLAQGRKNRNGDSQNFLMIRKLSKVCADAGCLKEIWERTIIQFKWRSIWGYADSMSRIHTPSKSENIPTERVDSFEYENRSSLGCKKSILTKDVIVLISWLNPCLKTKQFHGPYCEWNQ